MEFRETFPSEPIAHQLLADYFTSRELGFAGVRGYTIVHPGDEQFTPPRGVFLVVERDGDSVGCGGIREIDGDGEGDGAGVVRFEVKHLWVEPRARGTGLGGKLLDELELRALRFGATESVLDTNASLESAAALYRSRGYLDIPAYNDNPNATNWYGKTLRG